MDRTNFNTMKPVFSKYKFELHKHVFASQISKNLKVNVNIE